ncbi:hypothetical protein [Flavobacterium sp.]|uniref:hypothetical protein n=1 Tax=Flavobacterium sp. TaxID=239 RepID=UPI00286E9492|nr:hypothetical protein [Flavobacterium sp.]
MKTLKNTFVILLIAVLAFSCGNDDAPAPAPTPTFDYFLRAKVDGVQYQTDAAFRVLSNNNNDRITITSVLADNRNFKIQIDRPIGTVTYSYPAPSTEEYVLRMEYGDASSATALWRTGTCSGTTGTLTITALSATEISGTFSFTGKRTGFCSDPAKVITEGSFKSGITQ